MVENKNYVFIGIEPYKKGFARAVQFGGKRMKPKICFYSMECREFFKETKYKIDFIRIHFLILGQKKTCQKKINNKRFLLTSYDLLKKGGSIEIITDSSIYQRHLEELISQSYFKKIKDFPITCQISTFHKKAIEKGHL